MIRRCKVARSVPRREPTQQLLPPDNGHHRPDQQPACLCAVSHRAPLLFFALAGRLAEAHVGYSERYDIGPAGATILVLQTTPCHSWQGAMLSVPAFDHIPCAADPRSCGVSIQCYLCHLLLSGAGSGLMTCETGLPHHDASMSEALPDNLFRLCSIGYVARQQSS